MLGNFLSAAQSSAEETRSAAIRWFADRWPSASQATDGSTPIRVAQAGGVLPLPPRMMSVVMAASGQGQAAPPTPPDFDAVSTGATPPASPPNNPPVCGFLPLRSSSPSMNPQGVTASRISWLGDIYLRKSSRFEKIAWKEQSSLRTQAWSPIRICLTNPSVPMRLLCLLGIQRRPQQTLEQRPWGTDESDYQAPFDK